MAAFSFTASGCMPFSMGLATPILVPPWVTDRMEDKYTHKNDHRTPIMPPIREGTQAPLCEDAPDEAQILRAMPRVARGIPYVYEEHREDIIISTERLVDKIDPPRFYPLIGPAQLHHCHWKCTIYYNEVIESGYPFPVKIERPSVQVVYIDKDHLHLYAPSPELQKSFMKDATGN
ncbi:MAG: hypothetical protein EXR99_05570 [Gemmataceae bacterium]|nr:hypothetical protein [Gemmataceae bacterium]